MKNTSSLPPLFRLFPLLAGVISMTLPPAGAADWPQWRGPQRDGVARGEKLPAVLPANPRILWKAPAGSGHSSVVISGNHLAYLDQLGDKEHAHLLDLATGKSLWDVPFADPAEYSNYGSGPRCTPIIDGDRLYAQSGRGEFRCFSLKDGKTLWRFNFEKDYGVTFLGNRSSDPEANQTAARRHGHNGAPVIDGNRIFVPVGSTKGATLVAFDKLTGKELWRAGEDNTAYSSLMVGTLAGVRQVVHLNADALVGVDVASGKILWRVPVKTGAKRHVFTPLIVGDTVTIASQTVGMIQFRISKDGAGLKAEPVWTNPAMKVNISSHVLVDGRLYGIGASKGASASEFACVDFKTGQTLWTKPGFGDYASTMAVGDKLLVLNSNGELFLLAADATAYKELGRMQACGKTYSFPALVNGVLYVRDDRGITAMSLEGGRAE
jgi:outer membrane protein assembly factor BamB